MKKISCSSPPCSSSIVIESIVNHMIGNFLLGLNRWRLAHTRLFNSGEEALERLKRYLE